MRIELMTSRSWNMEHGTCMEHALFTELGELIEDKAMIGVCCAELGKNKRKHDFFLKFVAVDHHIKSDAVDK